MTLHEPTPEQQQAIDAVATGGTVVIEAGAGTGKTTTLAMAARAADVQGTYLAFNKAIANDAGRSMPMGVQARTVHSIAYRAINGMPAGPALLSRIRHKAEPRWKAANRLGLGLIKATLSPGVVRTLQPSWQVGHVMRAISRFCQSADSEPGVQHFPWVDGLDLADDTGARRGSNNRELAKALLPALRDAWADLTSPGGQLKFTHDVYVKLAQLNGHPIPGRVLLFDEAQDASPVMMAWLADQQDAQVVYVGDSQQQIYEWRGAVNALALVDAERRTWLTQSWRFGQGIADVANLVLDRLDAGLRLTGAPGAAAHVVRTGRAPAPDAILCRTNAMAVEAVLEAQRDGLQPHLVGGSDDLVYFATAAGHLQAGKPTAHPELACFESWRQVQEYVDQDPQGDELRTMVRLIDNYGPQIVVDALSGLMAEDGADVVVSTAHKAKGREWPSVRLAPDFDKGDDAPLPPPELRLLYVAVTRARQTLDVRACAAVRDMLEDAA